MHPMLTITTDPWTIDIAEPVGCAHDAQVIAVPAPPGSDALITLHDANDPSRLAWLQRSQQDPACGFLLLPDGLPAWDILSLRPGAVVAPPAGVAWWSKQGMVENGRIALHLAEGSHESRSDDGLHPGPVLGLRLADGPWRGAMHYDTRHPAYSWLAAMAESGPLRCVWDCLVRFAPGQHHRLRITLDAGSAFAVIDEDFHAGVADQVVWDFTGDDLPERFLLADSTAAHQEIWPNHDIDCLVTRLAPWTQCSQQPDRSDAYALRFAGGDTLGVVSLDGGSWRGGRLNLLELWTRRWAPGEAAARRGLPAQAKADETRCDGVPGRGTAVCRPHTCLEGWLGQGSRRWALALQPATAFEPVGRGTAPIGHFDLRIDAANYRTQQGLLRRLHTQHGVLGLQRQLDRVFNFPHPQPPASGVARSGDERILDHPDVRHWCPPAGSLAKLTDYLEARVLGCWEGSGMAAVNVVVGRPICACMLAYERFVAEGALDTTAAARMRARIAWLAYLNADANFYTGEVTMRPLGDPDGSEPTMMGMANQNFYTDALVIPGMFAEVFPGHPASTTWRDWAVRQWDLQLGFHLYPESGVWEESHTYCQHVLVTVFPWLVRLRDCGGPDLFADERLQRMLGSLVRQAAPPDADRGGRRVVVPFGDHGADPGGYAWIYRRYADAIGGGSDMATRLRWLHRGLLGQAEPTILASEHLRGLASMFRGRDATGHESLLALRSGGAWGHHHEDDGSVWLYAAGRGLIGDAACADTPVPHSGRKHAPDGHSRWTPRGIEHRSFLWRFARGHPLAHDLNAAIPYSLAWCPLTLTTAPGQFHLVARRPWHHQRLVAQLAPGLWLVHDRCRPGLPADVRFQVCGEPQLTGSSARVVLPAGAALTLTSLAGHQPTVGLHDRSSGSRPAGEQGADTWEVLFPCAAADSCVLIAVGANPVCRVDGDGWGIRHGATTCRVALAGDRLRTTCGETAADLPLWLEPPLRGADPA
jgi:hypothetical protein